MNSDSLVIYIMESVEKNENVTASENRENYDLESAENFQKFITELFEKNGVLSDLRTYLRKHIVNLLKSAQIGDLPACQKHFTQRLELSNQALNILVAEYLLRLDFSYSLSVFVSEIPLANMVFNFSKDLLKSGENNDYYDVKFTDTDVWAILNYLGIKCDSYHANKIVDMYKSLKQTPLLLCILKCMPMYCKGNFLLENTKTSEETVSSSDISSNEGIERRANKCRHRCKHYRMCKSCQNRIFKLKEKYKKRKKYFGESCRGNELNALHLENVMKNVNVTEKSLVHEMFQELKTVFETELELSKAGEDKRIKRYLQKLALDIEKRREELEESFRSRVADMEHNVQQKKKFLWNLAKALRDQHSNVTNAMRAIEVETKRLTEKEENLKVQLADAEELLKRRGEEMRAQITSELAVLEGHLNSMKAERDCIAKERSQIEEIKAVYDRKETRTQEENDLKTHRDLLRDELSLLKKYIESMRAQPKCVIERCTLTESCDGDLVLNNGQGMSRSEEDKCKTPNQVVNDLKKQKNVNFRQPSVERSRSSSDGGDATRRERDCDCDCARLSNYMRHLEDENERLRIIATRQRPATAPPCCEFTGVVHQRPLNASMSAEVVGEVCGRGERLAAYQEQMATRAMRPHDTIPFVGIAATIATTRDHNAQRRAIFSCPLPHKFEIKNYRTTEPTENISTAIAQCNFPKTEQEPERRSVNTRESGPQSTNAEMFKVNVKPVKSPQSLLREAKEKLKSKDNVQVMRSGPSRERSPSSVLREAKLRLRKLEIEAEAVEKSYLHFRNKQTLFEKERVSSMLDEPMNSNIIPNLEISRRKSLHKLEQTPNTASNYQTVQQGMKSDFDKYLKEYQAKFNLSETHFKNRNTVAATVKPIPGAFSEKGDEDYVDTPLAAFRKLYNSPKSSRNCREKAAIPVSHKNIQEVASPPSQEFKSPDSKSDSGQVKFKSRKTSVNKLKNDKKAQFEILKQNISKMYNIDLKDDRSRDTVSDEKVEIENDMIDDQNQLKIEVEPVSESDIVTKNVKEELLLVVQSCVDKKAFATDSEVEKDVTFSQGILVSSRRDRNSPNAAKSLSIDMKKKYDENNLSNLEIELDLSKGKSNSISAGILEGEDQDYPDDFSADVDNYNSRSDYGNNSPLSLPKTSDDENFWDS